VNKKIKKKIEVQTKKLASLRQQLAGVKKQPDDPAELDRLTKEVEAVEAEIQRLKSS